MSDYHNRLLLLEKRLSKLEKIINENKFSSTKDILTSAGSLSTKLPLSSDSDINAVKKYLDNCPGLISLAKVPGHPRFAVNGQKPKVSLCLRSSTDLNYVYINVSDIERFAKMCSKISRDIKDDTTIVRMLSHVSSSSSISLVKQIKDTFLVQYLQDQPIIPIQYTDKLCDIFRRINESLESVNSNYRIGFGVYSGSLSVSSRYRLKSSNMKFESLDPVTSLRVVVYTPKKKKNTNTSAQSVSVLIDKSFAGKGYSLDNVIKPSQLKGLFASVEDTSVKDILFKFYPEIRSIVNEDIKPSEDASSRADVDAIYAIQVKGDKPHFICYIEQNDGGYKLVSADNSSDYTITSNGITKL